MQGLGRERGNSSRARTTFTHLLSRARNGIGHAEVILKTCEDAGCDIIGLQEVRRDGRSAFTVAGYVAFGSGADGGKHEKKGNHGVGLAVRESIVAGMDTGDVAVECTSARLMKVCIRLKDKSNVVSFNVRHAPTLDRAPAKNITFGVHLRWSRGYPLGTTSLS